MGALLPLLDSAAPPAKTSGVKDKIIRNTNKPHFLNRWMLIVHLLKDLIFVRKELHPL
jgi:hypothetical protein